MDRKLRAFGIIAAALAFAICLTAGIWILAEVGFDTGDGAVSTGIGLYFVGKAIFVGTLTIVTTLHQHA